LGGYQGGYSGQHPIFLDSCRAAERQLKWNCSANKDNCRAAMTKEKRKEKKKRKRRERKRKRVKKKIKEKE
jgi:hypothetical protein